jgi:hypothetical protein
LVIWVLLIGSITGLASTGLLQSMLFGVGSGDPLVALRNE